VALLAATVVAVSTASAGLGNVTGVLTATTGTIKVAGAPLVNYSSNQNIDVFAGGRGLTGGGVQSTSKLNQGLIEFQNGVIGGGPGGSSTAFTEVTVVYQNTSLQAVQAVLDSTLLPAGLGFMIGDITSDVGPGICGNTQLNQCGQTGNNVSFSNVSTASAGFFFDVLSNGVSIYSLAGSMMIDANGNVTDTFDVPGPMGSARSVLKNFALQTVPGSGTAIGYNWDSTIVSIVVPGLLAAGASATLTYRVSTYATSTGNCAPVPGANAFNQTCAIGFSVFGDPIRSGGGINNSGTLNAKLSQNALLTIGTPISSIAFNTLGPLLAPTFDSNTGKLGVFLPAPQVPEPASWAMMIAGFAMVGGAMRRRAAFA
ncbi:MAG: PEPxxWA-CTERM sorting domain-containing protein, partial [Polymorphobacter sp.]